MNDRRGFSLVELLIVAVLGSLLLMAAYQVLITNQRAYTIQNTKMEAQQATRAAMDVLFAELREISPAGGDIVDMDDGSLEVRTMRTFGVVCDVDMSLLAPQLTVVKVAEFFEDGDSVFVFADNNPDATSDDVWIDARITSIDTTATCSGQDAQRMNFGGQVLTFTNDQVLDGAPVRNFTRFEYGLMTYGGEVYLGRRENSGDWVPLVGPLRDADTGAAGIDFDYFDVNGNPTTVGTNVRQIVVTVRTWSQVTDRDGRTVLDTLRASIFTRN